ncbi:MAG: hypothetical protein V3S11_06850 [Elusimicrobiota bacterium]
MPAKRRKSSGREHRITFSLKFTESQLFWLIVGLGLLVIEPFVIYIVLYDKVHQERAMVADAGRDLQKFLRVPSIPGIPRTIAGPGHPMPDYKSDIITPLNVRDPAALVMPPSGSYYRQPPRRRDSLPGGPARFSPSKSRAAPDPGSWEFSSYQ